jgi:hypothetical protein
LWDRFNSALAVAVLFAATAASAGETPVNTAKGPLIETTIPDCLSASFLAQDADGLSIELTVQAHPGTCGCRSKVMRYAVVRDGETGAEAPPGTFVLEPAPQTSTVHFPLMPPAATAGAAVREIRISCAPE